MTSSARFDERSVESIRHELEVNLLSPLMLKAADRARSQGRQPWGKAIHPLVTCAVSGMGRVRSDYTELVPDAGPRKVSPSKARKSGRPATK